MAERKFVFIPPVAGTTDSTFLRQVQDGSEKAWDEFYRKYSAMIRFVGKKRSLTPEECDDLMVEVMTTFWKKMDTFVYNRGQGRFRNYLGRIADYCAMMVFARNSQHKMLSIDTIEEYPDEVDEKFLDEWRDYLLELALEELKEKVDTETYQVFYMSFVQGLSVSDITAVTRKTPASIYVIRSRCFSHLSSFIAHYRKIGLEMSSGHSHKKA